MAINHEDETEDLRLATILGNVVQQSINEKWVISQLEAFDYMDPKPASLTVVDEKLSRLSRSLGGPGRTILQVDPEIKPEFDTYASATIRESIRAFNKARSSVCRAHLYLIGSATVNGNPDLVIFPDLGEVDAKTYLIRQVESNFWEHTETSYIRLASFWDRLCQVLDFAFFNIRQYERDGFPAVIERIRANFLPMHVAIEKSESWRRLRAFQNSEQPEGLKWLLRRRNLLVHSLHLTSPVENEFDNPIFVSAYNHLDESIKNRLRPGNPEEEVVQLHQHLAKAADLYMDAIEVALLWTEHKQR